MKTKFYLLTTFVFIAMALSAQRYEVMNVDEWNSETNAWTNSLRTTNTFDANGKLTEATTQEWNAETNVWTNALNISNTLNPDGNILETQTKAWNAETNQWEDAFKTLFTYSQTQKVLTETTQMGLEGIWIDFIKVTNTYNESDQLASAVTQILNLLTLELINADQTTYTYNADGTENQSVLQAWNATTSGWENSERNTYTYNESQQVTQTLVDTLRNEVWVNRSRSTFTYNEAGEMAESVDQNWVNEVWVNDSREMFSYNEKVDIEQIISQQWNSGLAAWVNELRIRYEYDYTGIDPLNTLGKVAVFPNPFIDQLTIQSGSLNEFTIQVFNTAGQLIKSFKTNGTVTNLYLGQLQKGVYFLKIKSAQNEQTIKLLKAR